MRHAVLGGGLLALVIAASAAPAAAAPEPAELVSTAVGQPADGPSFRPSTSVDGRWIAFESNAANLVAGDANGKGDIFVRDRRTGVTVRASVPASGGEANGRSYDAALAPNGRSVAFTSDATNLVPGDTNGVADVFVRDLVSGTTTRASVTGGGAELNRASGEASLTNSGRYIAFTSSATNLPGGGRNVYVRDVTAGTTVLGSRTADGTALGGSEPAISADGRVLAFTSHGTFADEDEIYGDRVLARDLPSNTTELVSVTLTEWGSGRSYSPSISADGRYVAFTTADPAVTPGDVEQTEPDETDVVVRDRQAGTSTRVSARTDGTLVSNDSALPSISGDGRYVAFLSADDLTSPYPPGTWDARLWIRDLQTGVLQLISVEASDQESYAWDGPSIAGNGKVLAFSSPVSVAPGDAPAALDVFAYKRP